MKINWLISALTVTAMGAASVAMAEDMSGMHDPMQHDHGGMQEHGMTEHDGGDHQMVMPGGSVFLVKKDIDGYQVSFHVMQVEESMQHGGTHNFMAKVEKEGAALTDLVVNSKVTHPNGDSESKMLMKMGDWYMAGYDLTHEGDHQVMVLFKTADGQKHFGGVYYPMGME